MKREVKIGLAILFGAVLLYISVAWVKKWHIFSGDRLIVKVQFQDLAGLKEGDPVAVFGYPCGYVSEVILESNGALAILSLEDKVHLKSDATAEVRVKELMGSKQVWLEPGKAAAPLAADAIIVGKTSLDFPSAMAKAGEFMDSFGTDQIDSLMRNINKAASAFGRMSSEMDSLNARSLLNDVSASASSLNRILSEVERRQLIADMDKTLGQVDHLSARAEKTMDHVDELAEHLNEKTLPNADEMLAQLNKMLDETEGMVTDLKSILKQVQDKSTTAGRLLYDPTLDDLITKSLDNLNVTLDHIRTKKIYVTMTLSKGQKVFSEEPIEVNGEKVEKK